MSCEVSDKSKNDSSKADHLNTRIPYGIRPVVKVRSYTIIVFQSTHPVWDATREVRAGQVVGAGFQSTHPVWDATPCGLVPNRQASISIHASRMGCDTMRISPESTSFHFNPRIPYGMRHLPCVCDIHCCKISIHASRMGCDTCLVSAISIVAKFQSTHPVWDATFCFA